MMASTISYSTPAFKFSHNGTGGRLKCPTFSHPYHGKIYHSSNPTIKLVVSRFKVSAATSDGGQFQQIHILKERLLKSIQDSTREFPWKKAEDILMNHSFHIGKKLFSWFFIAWFSLAFISDVTLAVSRNKEWFMPLGLFAGCALTEILKETSLDLDLDLFRQSDEEKDLKWHLLGIGCFFLLLRLMSVCLPIGGRVLFLHIANGGLMQILWLWRTAAAQET